MNSHGLNQYNKIMEIIHQKMTSLITAKSDPELKNKTMRIFKIYQTISNILKFFLLKKKLILCTNFQCDIGSKTGEVL